MPCEENTSDYCELLQFQSKNHNISNVIILTFPKPILRNISKKALTEWIYLTKALI